MTGCANRFAGGRAVVLIALFLLAAAPAAAQVLVSNTGQINTSELRLGPGHEDPVTELSFGFGTGDHPNGYTLSSVGIHLVKTAMFHDLNVEIWSARTHPSYATVSQPDRKLYDLTSPVTYSDGVNAFTAPAGAALRPETRYALVINRSGVVRSTASGNEDSATLSGWDLDNIVLVDRFLGFRVPRISINGAARTSAPSPVSLTVAAVGGATSVAEGGGINLTVTPLTAPSLPFTATWSITGGATNPIGMDPTSNHDADGNVDGSSGDWPDIKISTMAAHGGGDGLGKVATLAFPAGSISARSIRIEPFDDSLEEADETFTLILSSSSTEVTPPTPAQVPTITIIDDDGPPDLQTATVNTDALTLFHDISLDEGSTPATSAFSVAVDGVAAGLSGVTVSGQTVVLTLAAPVARGEIVTVSYTVPTNNPIRAGVGKNAPAFTNLTATNITPGICGRTQQVRTAILAAITGVTDCADVTPKHLAAITTLELDNQSITALKAVDLHGFTALTELQLNGNRLTALPDLSSLTTLTHILAYDNQLTALPDLTDNTALTHLHARNNQLTALPDLSRNAALTELRADNNQLTALPDLSSNASLTILRANDNRLTTLPDLSGNTALTELHAYTNQLTALPDLSHNTALTTLSVSENRLTALPDLSGNTALTTLIVFDNQLITLPDLGRNTALTTLYAYDNRLTTLPDLSGLSSLDAFIVHSNPLSNLDALTLT